MAVTILLVQHVEMQSNVAVNYVVWVPEHVNPADTTQARFITGRLSRPHFSSTYSSLVRWAKTTARYIAVPYKLEVLPEASFNKIKTENGHGLNVQDIPSSWPVLAQKWSAIPELVRLLNGKSLGGVKQPAVRILNQIAESAVSPAAILTGDMLLTSRLGF